MDNYWEWRSSLRLPQASANYQAFLRSHYWHQVKQVVLSRDNYTCRCCNTRTHVKRLEVHHITYEHHGDEANHLEDLVTVCGNCHAEIHGKPERWNEGLTPISKPLVKVAQALVAGHLGGVA